jgi:acetyl-CoA C-acetyltransferase
LNQLTANTPVIIGVGFYQEHHDNPLDCLEPFQLMVRAIRDAADNASSSTKSSAELLAAIESISVNQGMWDYPNPGKLVADELGCPNAVSGLADLGVLQFTPLFNLCREIAAGERKLGVVTGGEAKFRELRSKITGQTVNNTQQPEDSPQVDVHLTSSDPFASELEAQAGIFLPVQLFAIIESALRHHQGLGIEEHRDLVAQLYSGFCDIAARNPHAWKQESVSAEEIRDAIGNNAMLAFPYTKRHNTQWNVNQSVAILVSSCGMAESLGVNRNHWVYPVSQVQSRHVVTLAQQNKLYSHPGTIMSGERALMLAGASIDDITAADLYSCFPASVRSFAHDLNLQNQCPLSVTGSMAFAGGPYNHGALDGAARMVEVVRQSASTTTGRQLGLVSNLSGIFGKQAIALFSNQPNPGGYVFEDITDTVAAIDKPLPLSGDYTGPVTVVGYTVVFNKQDLVQAFAICDTPDGGRTVLTSQDKAVLMAMTRQEFVGREVQALPGRILAWEEPPSP